MEICLFTRVRKLKESNYFNQYFLQICKNTSMKKEKLRLIRKEKGATQQQIANVIATDVSNYCRKERGEVKIIKEEWQKIARFLNVTLEDIFEEEININIPVNNKPHDQKIDKENTYLSIINNLQDYIAILKEEIERLKNPPIKEDKN